MSTPYVAALTRTALAEHAAYKSHVETDPILAARIREYWEDIGKEFPGVETPWSGVFVSWCVLTSGATQEEFAASARHGDYVKWAIQNAKAGKGLFRGLPFEAEPPAPGDLIQWNRSNNTYDFAHAAQHASYPSHVAIVVSLVRDAMGMHALTVGGNESDTVGLRRIPVGADAEGRDRAGRPLSGANFAPQDYLSLASHPAILAAAVEAIGQHGVHSAGSLALQGGSDPLQRLTEHIAEWLGCTEAMIFPTGWAAGFGVIRAFVREQDHIVLDSLAHACLQEGAAATTRHVHRIPHLSRDALERRLARIRAENTRAGILVVTESLFSMNSTVPDIRAMQDICRAHEATLLVDVAHDLGAIGEDGRGFLSAQGMLGQVDLVMGSFSKTFASNGGFVASNAPVLRQALIAFAGPLTFSNALSPVQAAVVGAALDEVRSRIWPQATARISASAQRSITWSIAWASRRRTRPVPRPPTRPQCSSSLRWPPLRPALRQAWVGPAPAFVSCVAVKRRRSKPSDGAAFVAGFKEAAVWAEPKPRQPTMELPLPDYAPFAVPSDEVWRELPRRRNLVRMIETLAQSARDEGFPLSSQILSETVGKLRAALIVAQAGRQPPKPRRSPRSKTHQAAETSKTKQSAPSRRRKKQTPAQDQPVRRQHP